MDFLTASFILPYADKFWRGENLAILAILVRNRQIKSTPKFIFFRHRQIKSTPNLIFFFHRQIKSTLNLIFFFHRQIKSMKNSTFFTHKNIAKHSLGHFLISFSKEVITER